MPPNRILIVRLGAMGDVIHALPAVSALKRTFPGSHITWAIHPRWTVLLKENPHVDAVLPVDRKTWPALRAALRELRRTPFDLALDLQGLIQSALLTRWSGAKVRTGFHATQAREALAAWFYTQPVQTAMPHVVDKYRELAQAAGAQVMPAEFPLPAGTPEGGLPAVPFVLASPLAGWTSKQWPLEYYAELARLLPCPLVVNGAPAAEATLRSIPGVYVHLSGIEGLIHATRQATAVLGVDSGPLHLAAALAKPGVALFGPTDPARNGPYGTTIQTLRSPTAITTYKRENEIHPSMRSLLPTQISFGSFEFR